MAPKTSGEENLPKTRKKQIRILMALVILSIVVLPGAIKPAGAYTAPYRLMVFTDKQVYLDFGYNVNDLTYTNADNTKGSFNQRPNVFALLLDSDGNIVRGLTGSNFSATLNDFERWNHSGPGLDSYPFYTVIPTGGLYYNNLAFPAFSDVDGDGIFNSTLDVTDLNSLAGNKPAVTDQVNISISVTISYLGVDYTRNVSVIFGTAGCNHPTNAITSAHNKAAHDDVPCTVCHWGYQYGIGAHGPNNSLMYNDPARYTGIPAWTTVTSWDYKLGYVKTGGNQTTWDNSNASFCMMCHGGPLNRNILDLGAGSAPVSTDQNGDGLPDNNRPSCSWYQGPLGNGSTYPGCHAPAFGSNGSTKIAGTQLYNVDWKGWSQTSGQSKAHNHSTQPSTLGAPCELCHAGGGAPGTGTGGMHNVAGIPNESTDYLNINDQCWNCHNRTDGWLNITANGGTAMNHSRTNQCSNCHNENNKLNVHSVPTGAFGGRWCLNCHNLTGKAPIDHKVDPAITNISNPGYIHYKLNNKSDATNSSRICWGCHTNDSLVANSIVNSTDIPVSEHPDRFDQPRNCTACHYNGNAMLNFSAPQVYRHTWYAPAMRAPAVTYCPNCHAKDEMLNPWNEGIYPPKTDNESASHYGKNRSFFFEPLIGSRQYCGYCHQNESTVMGPFAKPSNKVRSDHASRPNTPGCGNTTCHRPGRMHEDTLRIPDFTESNITSTCLSCHNSSNYNFHNSTVTCWDCHMGNVSNNNPTWIHPIQFIQYNGNYTGAKLTGATCYDCHKSTRVDSTISNASGKTPPKIYNQRHSNDPINGTKWGDYWKYTPTTYEFVSYRILGNNGTINPSYPFENIKVPSNDYMELIETQSGSNNGGTFPYNRAEQQINGPPVPNWTSSTKVTAGTTTLIARQDGGNGNPAGSLKASLTTSTASGSGSVFWNYSFYYKPNSTQFSYTNASVDYNITVSTALTQSVYLRLVKPSGAVATLANASSSSSTGWVTLSNNSFASELNEDGSAVPYKIQLYAALSGGKPATNIYTVYFDNIILKFHEKVWNRYEIELTTVNVPVNGSSKLGMSYQVHAENTSLLIYNKTSQSYDLLDTMDKGVFFDYTRDINSTHHINSTDGITGNVTVKFMDDDRSDTDEVSDNLHIRYLYVYTDHGLQFPCEQCHSPNKHYINPTLGSPFKFRAGNAVNQSISSSGTWCQQCHWQGAANYSKMIQEFNVTRKPPENIPPEITGNATYAPLGGARDSTPYKNHTGLDLSDLGCFGCHGGNLSQSAGMTAFVHGVSEGIAAGGPNCISCHDVGGSGAPANFRINASVMKQGVHKNLNSNATNSSAIDPINKACWACHGSGEETTGHHTSIYTCLDCHNITNNLTFTTNIAVKTDLNKKKTAEHIPYYYENISSTRNNPAANCTFCHNQSLISFTDTASSNVNSNVSHYADNSSLVYPTTACNLCHSSPVNASKYSASVTRHPARTSDISYCRYCHNTTNASSLHSQSLDFRFGGTASIHGGSTGTNYWGFDWEEDDWNESRGLAYRDDEGCNACHFDSANFSAYANICENCHLPDGSSLFTGPRNRGTGLMKYNASVNDTIPRVYSHTNYSSVNVPNQSKGGVSGASGCYGFGNVTCHGVDYFNRSSAGGYFAYNYQYSDRAWKSDPYHFTNTIDRMPDTRNCLFCHNQSDTASRAAWGGARQVNASNMYGAVSNQDCYNCHTVDSSAPKDFHASTLIRGTSGGANCTSCHDIGGSAGAGRLVNFTGMNNTDAIHKELNKGAASPSGYPSSNFRCWACHGNGSEPGGGHPANYKTPYRCTDCHVPGTGQNMNYTPKSTLLNVSQHYWNGSNVSTSARSCYDCHNRSEMTLGSVDPDGAASVYGGANGGNNSTSHYGIKRSNLGGYSQNTNGYCNYCHNTTINNATFYVGDFNNTIFNHSAQATTPLCSNCHNTGRIHNSTLAKPVSNDAYCSTCHGIGGGASTNNKVEHKALYCTECHANNTAGTLAGKDIHAVKYLTKSNTFSISNSSAVDCVTCHQTTAVDSSMSGFSAFKITSTMRHSDNISNGSVWDGYWTNTLPQTACIYCHSSTLHNATPLGRILQWSPNYKMYGNIGSNISCSDCHYKGDSNYSQMNLTFVSAGLRAPPEITNGTNWKGNFSNYYNHSLDAYDDATCKGCHGSLLSGSANMTEFMHNAATGVSGGANCTACHNIAGTAGAGKLVNFSAMNDSNAIHRNLNRNAPASDANYSEDKRCWACHGNGSEPSGHPANYRTPYNCTDCHLQGAGQNFNYTPAAVLNVTQHYWGGSNISTASVTSCYACHNRTEMMLGLNLDPDGTAGVYGGANGGNNSTSHYGKKRNDMVSMDTTTYCTYCHNTTTNNATFYVSDYNNTVFNHSSRATTPLCTGCHNNGRLHNSTLSKPVSNDSYCSTCHGPGGSALTNNKTEHKTLYCTECHANSSMGNRSGKDIHAIKYLTGSNTFSTTNSSAVNCVTCHQTSSVDSSLSGFAAFKITNPMHHSDNASNGSVWGSYWTNTSQQTACIYCHSNTTHNATPLGRILQWAPNYRLYGSIGSNLSCSDCHYKGDANYSLMNSTFASAGLPVPPEITNGTNWNGGFSNYYNHSLGSFTDQDCKNCHGSLLSTSANMSEFMHNAATGVNGGPNCTACHNIGGSAGAGKLVNFSAMNDSNTIHKNLNSLAATALPSENKKCWACHGNGSEPGGGHPANYRTPYNCTDCHLQGAGQNFNYTPAAVLNVTQHYWGGTSINTSAAITCYACHNRSEMMLGGVDPDGAAGVYGGVNGGNNSTSHYGRKRTDYPAQGTNDYCYKCHSNASAASVFPYSNPANATIANHSMSYPSTNPACGDCHAAGRLHNDTLYKPYFSLPNSTYCLSCHGSGGNATIKNLERHNSTSASALNCTQCHLNSTMGIHPARYLQQGGTWDTSKTNAVNCTTCHQGSGLAGFNTAPITPGPMNHSTNPYSGALWNNTQPFYWTNTSQQSGCEYCHGKIAYHNSSGLGNITKVKGGNAVRQPLDTGRWCASCHYSGAANYAGNLLSPEPPEIRNASGKVPQKARDGTSFYDHSLDMVTGYNDSKCKNCHNNALDAAATSLNFSHNLAPGGGGANCTACHYTGASVQNINITALNDANSIHKDLNKGAQASDNGYNDSKKCWACHGDGNEPSGHPTRYKTPYNCTDCHVQGAGQNFNYTPNNTVLNVTRHYWNGSSVRTPAANNCYTCHNTTGMITAAFDPDGASANVYGGANGGNDSVSHYGRKRSDMAAQVNTTPYCSNCHNGASPFPFIDSANRTIANHSLNYPATNPACKDCHDGGRIHNSSLYKISLNPLPNATYCLGCHGAGGSASKNNLERHNNTGTTCTQCHMNTSDNIHPVRYLQQDNSWATSKINAVNCTTCHQGGGLSGFGSAPKTPVLAHSTNPYSGALWNGTQQGFWSNTSQQSGCDYCHGRIALHNLSGLGNITRMKGSNNVRQGFTGGYWCANCHYGNAANYSGTQFTPQPPEVRNNSGLVPALAKDSTQFYNHSADLVSGYDDAKCKTCHDNKLAAGSTSLNFTHSLGAGGGGPDCISCHGLNGSLADGKRINQTSMNSSIHKDLNRNTPASDANYSESKKCWACHGDGTEPSGHPARYKTPYTCVDCHVPGTGQNMNYNPNGTLLNVTQHYWNGTSINTTAATSCYACHNRTEMMTGITPDPDGAATVYGGANGGNQSVSHYGKRRGDLAGLDNTTYCNYCHNNQSSAFPFINQSNTAIANHSMNYAATNPVCMDCHASGRLHNSTLYKPAFALPNSSYCLSCHGNNGNGGTNYTGAVTAYKERHNNSLCMECHLNSTLSIHPVRYLRYNSTWSVSNGSAVNCTSCHQGTGLANFSTAPLVQTPLWHSNNTYSGALWNGTQARYWDNKSQQSGCDYCHGKTALHNSSGLGISSEVQGTNLKNQSLSGSFWCANCHYKGSAPNGKYNYRGDILNPVPPEIFNLTGLVPANASDGMQFQNHSTNIAGDWSDNRCRNCHGKDLPTDIKSGIFVHKLNKSALETGGPDCLKCHASTATYSESDGAPTNIRVNKTAFTNYSVHRNVNSNATSTVSLSDNRSKACWACHSDGTQPIKHPIDYINPKACDYCHVSSNLNTTPVYRHYPGAVFLGSIVYDSLNSSRTCVSCHNNSVVANQNISYGSSSPDRIKNASVSHYTVNRSTGTGLGTGVVTGVLPNTTQMYGCTQCHAVGELYGQWGSSYGNARIVPTGHNDMGATSQACESACHNTGPVPVNLHNISMSVYIGANSCYSTGCHIPPPPPTGTCNPDIEECRGRV